MNNQTAVYKRAVIGYQLTLFDETSADLQQRRDACITNPGPRKSAPQVFMLIRFVGL